MGESGNVVPCKYVSASSMDPNFIGKVICFLQIFLPALSIGPLVPQVFCQCEEFSLSPSIWADIWKAFADENDKMALPERSYIENKIKC